MTPLKHHRILGIAISAVAAGAGLGLWAADAALR
jgi:hypothetical protein